MAQQENRASHAVKYTEKKGHWSAEWQIPCEIISETRTGRLKVREFYRDKEMVKYVDKIRVIEL